jgi:DNA-binding NarL/FixJ family response regulator
MKEQVKASLRVFLADDHPVVLAGIKSLLSCDPELEMVGEAQDGHTALQMAFELKPDVVILDLSMPGLNGVEVTQQLLAKRPDCKVLVLTVHEDRSYLRKLIEVGAAGYVLKRSASEDLLRAIHAVASGGMYLDPAIAGQVFDTGANRSRELAPGRGTELSEREIEVLRLTALGHSNKSIATILDIGVKSVETYKARAMDKLGFRSRVELVGYAVGQGWLAEV